MFILVLILKWSYASLVGAEAGEVKFSPIFKELQTLAFDLASYHRVAPLGRHGGDLAPPPLVVTTFLLSSPLPEASAGQALGAAKEGGGGELLALGQAHGSDPPDLSGPGLGFEAAASAGEGGVVREAGGARRSCGPRLLGRAGGELAVDAGATWRDPLLLSFARFEDGAPVLLLPPRQSGRIRWRTARMWGWELWIGVISWPAAAATTPAALQALFPS